MSVCQEENGGHSEIVCLMESGTCQVCIFNGISKICFKGLTCEAASRLAVELI